MISYDPYFVHLKKHAACLVPPQQFQIDIFIPGSEIDQLSGVVFGVIFSSPKCKRIKWYHIWCTRFSCLLYILSLSQFLSFILISCLLKDHFASKPINKHTTVHLKSHDLNSSHCYYIVQWKYNAIYNTYVTAWVQLVQSIHLRPPTEANIVVSLF